MTAVVIFDWDGTLVDSCQRIIVCMDKAAKDLDIEAPDPEAVRSRIGISLQEMIPMLYPDMDLQTVNDYIERYRHWYLGEDDTPMEAFSYARELLHELREAGLQLAVATGKSRVGLDHGFEQTGFADYFVSSRCADESAPKPNPLMLQQLLEELDCEASQAVMVGDTSFDLEMANAAGMPSIAVTHGAHGPDALSVCKPVALCQDLQELAAHLLARA